MLSATARPGHRVMHDVRASMFFGNCQILIDSNNYRGCPSEIEVACVILGTGDLCQEALLSAGYHFAATQLGEVQSIWLMQ